MYMEPEQPTVLIVEDHTATRHFLADNLAADGYEPIEAATAAEGLRLIASGRAELAVIDLGLPDRDGLELLTEVRSSARRGGSLDSQLPVLILSGRASESTASAASSAGPMTTSSSPSATRSSGPGWMRCCAAPEPGRAWDDCGWALWSWTRYHARRGSTGRPSTSRTRSSPSRCAWPRSRRVSSRAREFLSDVWGFRAAGTSRR